MSSAAVSTTQPQTQEDKVNHLKALIQTHETKNVVSVLQRRQAIAHILSSSEVPNSHIPMNEQDIQHQSAIFSSAACPETTSSQPQAHTKIESKASSFFNRKKELIITADAPLYKRFKVGDTVIAYFAGDGQFHKADIVSVMHGGYHSAQYDVQYHGYTEKATLSWTDMKPYSDLREEEEEEERGGMMHTSHMDGDEGGGVDSFGRSLSERAAQPTTMLMPITMTTEPVSITGDSLANRSTNSNDFGYSNKSIATANSNASDQFLLGMMHDSTTDAPTTLPESNAAGGYRHLEDAVVITYEAPIAAIKFPLEGIVDTAFFANRVKGAWRNVLC
jgi:hypothetical protein